MPEFQIRHPGSHRSEVAKGRVAEETPRRAKWAALLRRPTRDAAPPGKQTRPQRPRTHVLAVLGLLLTVLVIALRADQFLQQMQEAEKQIEAASGAPLAGTHPVSR